MADKAEETHTSERLSCSNVSEVMRQWRGEEVKLAKRKGGGQDEYLLILNKYQFDRLSDRPASDQPATVFGTSAL